MGSPAGARTLIQELIWPADPGHCDIRDLPRLHADISEKKRSGQNLQFNETGWGLADLPLPEAQPAAT